jgi:hypothetical protein
VELSITLQSFRALSKFYNVRLPSKFRYHFTYMTVCTVTGRYYLGMHSTDDLNDGYLGSGELVLRSINAHGAQTHVREILEVCVDREMLSKTEAALITEDRLRDPMCMNLVPGGAGGCRSDVQREKIRATLKGRKPSIEQLERLRLARKTQIGVPRSLKDRQAISASKKGIPFSEKHRKAAIEGKLMKRVNVVQLHRTILNLVRATVRYRDIVTQLQVPLSIVKSVVHRHRYNKCKTCVFHGVP